METAKTFPFEVRAYMPPRIATVEAFETAHPLFVIHEALEHDKWKGKWVLTHGPTSRFWGRFDSFEEAQKLASIVAQLDPDESILEIYDDADGHYNPPDEVRELHAEAKRIHAEQAKRDSE